MTIEFLNFILLPNFHLQAEWEKTSTKINRAELDAEKRLADVFKKSPYEALIQLAFIKDEIPLSRNLKFWRIFASKFIETLRLTASVETLREKQYIAAEEEFFKNLLLKAPFFQGFEYLNIPCLEYQWDKLNSRFQNEIKKFNGSVEEFFKKYSPDLHFIGKIYFHLVETKNSIEPFAFMATYSVGLNKNNQAQHRPLQYALTEFAAKKDKLLELLTTVAIASEKSEFMKNLLESGELFYPLNLTPEESFNFLKEIPIYEESGILCRIPNWWRSGKKGASLSLSFGDKKKKSLLGFESLVDFQTKIMIGGVKLTPEEARKILKKSEGLSQIKGKWVVVDKEKLAQSLKNWRKASDLITNEDLTLGDALRMLMMKGNKQKNDILSCDDVDINVGDWLSNLMDKMRNPQFIRETKVTRDFQGKLRPYQQSGLNWLTLHESLRFGACLADDMGLGKTIQVIALLNSLRKKKGYTPSLLILPASLIHNWADEIEKFTPKIKFAIAHPSGEKTVLHKKTDPELIFNFDLVITTYGMVKRYEWIQNFKWNYVILDEAQAIKNSNTAQTMSVKKLQSKNRLALTGTPVENRLADLWSLFNFLNPGLLGTKKEFTTFIKNSDELSDLRRIISPYILRRLKTDKNIISDLPDKIEVDTFAHLSKSQYVLYQQQVNKLKEALEVLDTGIQRKGLVLSSLMKFKQICNHPDQFLGNSEYSEIESGKFQRLREICETIREKREKILIFTQFKEITEYLAIFLEKIFGYKGSVLHGSIPVAKRKEMIKRFQSDEYIPFFILSIKAGGTGLNLTAANHVIHFDRWWNPAVENQATDRAFRIGQKKSVLIHKFITKGTIEEKISAMIEEKKQLSRDVLADSGEASFITEMSNNELINLFSMEG